MYSQPSLGPFRPQGIFGTKGVNSSSVVSTLPRGGSDSPQNYPANTEREPVNMRKMFSIIRDSVINVGLTPTHWPPGVDGYKKRTKHRLTITGYSLNRPKYKTGTSNLITITSSFVQSPTMERKGKIFFFFFWMKHTQIPKTKQKQRAICTTHKNHDFVPRRVIGETRNLRKDRLFYWTKRDSVNDE